MSELAADPSRVVSAAAVKVLTLIADDDTLTTALAALPPRRLPVLLGRLRRKRPTVVDRVIAARIAAGDALAWPLVPLTSTKLLTRHFDTAAERGGASFWRRLATVYPDRAAKEIIRRLNALTNPDGLLFACANSVVAALSDRSPNRALEVVDALRRHRPLNTIPLGVLARRQPEAVAALTLAATDLPAVSFERSAHRLHPDRIAELFRRGSYLLGDQDRWLARMLPATRTAVYAHLGPAWTAADGTVPVRILRRLPTKLRVTETRRVMAAPALASRPLARLPYAGLLPWAEAVEQTTAWVNHPEAENRAAALAALCEATRFDSTRLGDLLERLVARKHEQDPVRLVFLTTVAALPPRRWAAAHLPALGQLIRDALDAADLSGASAQTLGRLLFALLPVHPDWAAKQLAEVTAERGYLSAISRPLQADDVRHIAPVLTPVMRTWNRRENMPHLMGIAAAVGRHLPLWPELATVLEKIVMGTTREYSASSAMTLLLEHLPAERERLVLAALKKDKTWAYCAPVLAYLHARRQDLLTPYLGRTVFRGRFATGKVRYVLPLTSGFTRWTDEQQELFADRLVELAAPPKRKTSAQTTWDVLSAVRRLPALPAIGPERLVTLANDTRAAVKEAAVRALGRVDARRGVPELLIALGDPRARWAVYALRAALAETRPDEVVTLLRGVSLRSVTVAKEVLRLAGEFGQAAAVAWFAKLNDTKLHRDVRGALLRALWDHLDDPTAWAVLEANAGSPDAGVVIGLARIQADRASADARRRVAELLGNLLAHPEATVRVAVLDRLAMQPTPDADRTLLRKILAAIGSAVPDERAGGLRAALAGATDADAPHFATAFTDLLPRRRELAAAVELFAETTRRFGTRLAGVRRAVLDAVSADTATVGLQVRLAGAGFMAGELAEWVKKLVGSDNWRYDTPQLVLAELSVRNANEADEIEQAWAASRGEVVRWLAVRVLAQSAATFGWTADRRARLDRYRRDRHRVVSDAAAFTFPPETKA